MVGSVTINRVVLVAVEVGVANIESVLFGFDFANPTKAGAIKDAVNGGVCDCWNQFLGTRCIVSSSVR